MAASSGSASTVRNRVLLSATVVIIVACTIWIVTFVARSGGTGAPVEPTITANTIAVSEFNAELSSDSRFVNAGVELLGEQPLKIRVIGMVDRDADLEELEQRVSKKFPDAESEYDVLVQPR